MLQARLGRCGGYRIGAIERVGALGTVLCDNVASSCVQVRLSMKLYGTCTTQSAPAGRAAPVLTLAHCPAHSGAVGASPAVTAVRTRLTPAPSMLRQAYPDEKSMIKYTKNLQ